MRKLVNETGLEARLAKPEGDQFDRVARVPDHYLLLKTILSYWRCIPALLGEASIS